MMVDGFASNDGLMDLNPMVVDGFASNDGLMDLHPMMVRLTFFQ